MKFNPTSEVSGVLRTDHTDLRGLLAADC